MRAPIKAISLVNPRVLELVSHEVEHGVGRNATEAAENLIMEAAERRRLERAQKPAPSIAAEPAA